MNTDFPVSKSKFLKTEDFQDREMLLTYRGWEKKANEDDAPTKKMPRTWQQKLKYVLRYSYPEWAIDPTTGLQMAGNDGQPFRNRYWDAKYPHGYTIIYHFEEGQLETGSKPLFEAFCRLAPKSGEKIIIKKTGADKETKWSVKSASLKVHPDDVPSIDVDASELRPDDEVPF